MRSKLSPLVGSRAPASLTTVNSKFTVNSWEPEKLAGPMFSYVTGKGISRAPSLDSERANDEDIHDGRVSCRFKFLNKSNLI